MTQSENTAGGIEAALRAYLGGEDAPADLRVSYHIGSPFTGETEFEVFGDGRYSFWSTVTAGRQRREYSGTLDRGQIDNLIELLLRVRIWEVAHLSSVHGQDDPEVEISLSADGHHSDVVLWTSEVSKVAAFAEAQEAILDIVRSESAGEVLEVGR